MRKINKRTFCEAPEPTDCELLTRQYFGTDQLNVDALVTDMLAASKCHEFTEKSFTGWTSLPLRSLGGITGKEASEASGEHASSDPEKFEDTIAMQPYIQSLVHQVGAMHSGLLKVRLMKMRPGSTIGEHRDRFCGEHDKIMRFHIPIQTSPRVKFQVSRESYYLEPGKLYRVDVSKLHSVANHGDTDRIHLVFDVRRL